MTNSSLTDSKLKALLSEPTLHFFAIAVAIFALYAIFQSRGDKVLELDQRVTHARRRKELHARNRAILREVGFDDVLRDARRHVPHEKRRLRRLPYRRGAHMSKRARVAFEARPLLRPELARLVRTRGWLLLHGFLLATAWRAAAAAAAA